MDNSPKVYCLLVEVNVLNAGRTAQKAFEK